MITDHRPLCCIDGVHKEMPDGTSIPPHLSRGELWEYRLFGFNSEHSGWYPCTGGTMSDACWANLVAAGLSEAWTAAFGAQTLPDFAGRVLAQVGIAHVLGTSAGDESVTLSVGHLPAHSHTLTSGTAVVQIPVSTDVTNNTETPQDNYISTVCNASGTKMKGFDSEATEAAYLANPLVSGSTDSIGEGEAVSVMQPTAYAGYWHVYLGT